jgi:hypothetical protein
MFGFFGHPVSGASRDRLDCEDGLGGRMPTWGDGDTQRPLRIGKMAPKTFMLSNYIIVNDCVKGNFALAFGWKYRLP